jgi:predicted HTH transcriptional regulator
MPSSPTPRSQPLGLAPPEPLPASGPRRAGRPKGSGQRAAEALRIVREQPGVTIPELADRMGIKQNYLYRVLPELVQDGKVVKQGRGWHPRAA